MTLVRFNNWMPEFSNIMNNHFDRSPLFDQKIINTTIPSVNVYESEDDFQIEVAAPGYKKKNFSIEVDNNILKISAEKEVKERDGFFTHKKQFSYASFERSFNLPDDLVDESKISASYEDGILQIQIAKKEEAKPKPARMIQVA